MGERDGLTPPGFDWNNSPSALAGARVEGRGVVLTTSNGTAALRWLKSAPVVLAACLLNGPACAGQALALAGGTGADLGIACAGRGRRLALDDAVCAGHLVELAMRASSGGLELTDAALAARQLWLSNAEDVLGAFRLSGSGQRLAEIGQEQDVRFCARTAVSGSVPSLVRGAPDRFERVEQAVAQPTARCSIGRTHGMA